MLGRFAGLRNRLKKRGINPDHDLLLHNSNLSDDQIDMARQALQILGLESRQHELTKEDFVIFLYAMGMNPTEDIIDSKIYALKLHHKKTYTFGQLAHVWYSMLQDLADEDEILKRAFQFFDKDNNGVISINELKTTMHELGDLLTEEEIADFMNIMDVNNDGVIGYTEFLATLKTQAPDSAPYSRLVATTDDDASTVGSGMFRANAHFLDARVASNVPTSLSASPPMASGMAAASAALGLSSGRALEAPSLRASAITRGAHGGGGGGGRCSGGGAGGNCSSAGGSGGGAAEGEVTASTAPPGYAEGASTSLPEPVSAAAVAAAAAGTGPGPGSAAASLQPCASSRGAPGAEPSLRTQPAAAAESVLAAQLDNSLLLARPPSRRLGIPVSPQPQQLQLQCMPCPQSAQPQQQQPHMQPLQQTWHPHQQPQQRVQPPHQHHVQQLQQPPQAAVEVPPTLLQRTASRPRSLELAGCNPLRTPSTLEPGPGSGGGSPVEAGRVLT
ncbi:hypothetical protein Agub_g3578 [Astrephomene gubernaculifera]|uniref:EF-hand domain-containing protein n=1 Tax=Astrephomene gubernaculifera TaxID=47775 RepID=A0AAD3DIV3_9CHLO|nr:hypothetical protein Agub_g3578 [Astrephomene gubernaculifera]